MEVDEARAKLLARFLAASGPATPRDFAKWSVMQTSDAKSAFDSLGGDVVQVTVDGAPGWILRRDLPVLAKSRIDDGSPRLLPAFDPLLLAHASKEHLVERRFYSRVYRSQGWLSPVILVSGRIVGVWFLEARAKTYTIDVQPFFRFDTGLRRGIESEAAALGRFLGAPCDVRIT